MNGQEIRNKIDENNLKIREMLDNFVLNPTIQKILAENEELRSQCQHSFKDGVCEYCDAFEEYANGN